MSIEFAEKILDGMVDESGRCGERGLSEKQFDCIAQYLEPKEPESWVGWAGSRGGREIFQKTDYVGNVGKYRVWLNEFWHFNRRCTVVEIKPRPQDELEAERELERIGKFEHSEWVGEEKQRMELELTLIRDYQYDAIAYGYYDRVETAHIYTMADADGNCFIWKTRNPLVAEHEDEDGFIDETYAEPGDKVALKATVKEHGEYKGTKQTVLTRCKVNDVRKAA